MAVPWCICSLFSPFWKCFCIVEFNRFVNREKEMESIGPGTRSVYVMFSLAKYIQ